MFRVSGRGELHLTILIENMRREGYELAVSHPRCSRKTIDGVVHEPYEALTVDIDETPPGRRHGSARPPQGELKDMANDGRGRVRIEYRVPARGLIGFQGEFMNADARHRPASATFSTATRRSRATFRTATTAC